MGWEKAIETAGFPQIYYIGYGSVLSRLQIFAYKTKKHPLSRQTKDVSFLSIGYEIDGFAFLIDGFELL